MMKLIIYILFNMYRVIFSSIINLYYLYIVIVGYIDYKFGNNLINNVFFI